MARIDMKSGDPVASPAPEPPSAPDPVPVEAPAENPLGLKFNMPPVRTAPEAPSAAVAPSAGDSPSESSAAPQGASTGSSVANPAVTPVTNSQMGPSYVRVTARIVREHLDATGYNRGTPWITPGPYGPIPGTYVTGTGKIELKSREAQLLLRVYDNAVGGKCDETMSGMAILANTTPQTLSNLLVKIGLHRKQQRIHYSTPVTRWVGPPNMHLTVEQYIVLRQATLGNGRATPDLIAAIEAHFNIASGPV